MTDRPRQRTRNCCHEEPSHFTDNAIRQKLDVPGSRTARSGQVWSISASFYAETGMFTFDPGYTSTGACESARSPISMAIKAYSAASWLSQSKNWPQKSDFLEVAYLLQYGELPNKNEKQDWVQATSPITQWCMNS